MKLTLSPPVAVFFSFLSFPFGKGGGRLFLLGGRLAVRNQYEMEMGWTHRPNER